jgi:hypothetical protein
MEICSDGSFIAGDSTVYFSITSDISIEHKKLAKLYIEDGGLMASTTTRGWRNWSSSVSATGIR